MKTFLRDNLMIVVSIALPLLVVALFAIATLVPRAIVEGPERNLVLAMATTAGPAQAQSYRIELDVVGERLRARVVKPEGILRAEIPRIFEFVAADGAVREIEVVLPDDIADLPDGTEIPIPEFEGRQIATTLTSPDGWRFDQSRGGGGLFRELFGAGSRRYAPRIAKDGAVVQIDLPIGEPYYYYTTRFIGWVTK